MPDPPGFRETGTRSGWLFPACDIAHDEAGVPRQAQLGLSRRHMERLATAVGCLAMAWRCPWQVRFGGHTERAMRASVEGQPA